MGQSHLELFGFKFCSSFRRLNPTLRLAALPHNSNPPGRRVKPSHTLLSTLATCAGRRLAERCAAANVRMSAVGAEAEVRDLRLKRR